ncbi:hypothetical protein QLX08_005590 [Tetragonisca angustula]|uniref:Dipeptidylpeptidase IV N-terminal domain-containing protein n=1 Tax=Tetragonisca angustula TaxID=166442 RepID=A0AAW0ZZ85_9HYME
MTEGGPNISDLMTKNKQRNWRRLLAGCLVAVVVLGLVVAAAILLTGSPDFTGTGTPAAPGISLEEWLAGSLSPKSFNGTWISGNEILYRDETGNLLIYNVTSRKPRRILESSNNALMSSFDHQLSADRKYLLLAIDYQKVQRQEQQRCARKLINKTKPRKDRFFTFLPRTISSIIFARIEK